MSGLLAVSTQRPTFAKENDCKPTVERQDKTDNKKKPVVNLDHQLHIFTSSQSICHILVLPVAEYVERQRTCRNILHQGLEHSEGIVLQNNACILNSLYVVAMMPDIHSCYTGSFISCIDGKLQDTVVIPFFVQFLLRAASCFRIKVYNTSQNGAKRVKNAASSFQIKVSNT